MRLSKSEKTIGTVTLISLIFCVIYISSKDVPELFNFGSEIMDLLFAIAVSILAAFIFYLFQVFIPEKAKRKLIKKNIEKQYRFFKEDFISIFLHASKSHCLRETIIKLCDQEEFKKFFKTGTGEGQTKWHRVVNNLEGPLLADLLVELEILRDEISFTLSSIDFEDEELFSFFKGLSQAVYRLKNTRENYDDIKSLCSFLWEVFTGWNWVKGYRRVDIVQEMINKI